MASTVVEAEYSRVERHSRERLDHLTQALSVNACRLPRDRMIRERSRLHVHADVRFPRTTDTGVRGLHHRSSVRHADAQFLCDAATTVL